MLHTCRVEVAGGAVGLHIVARRDWAMVRKEGGGNNCVGAAVTASMVNCRQKGKVRPCVNVRGRLGLGRRLPLLSPKHDMGSEEGCLY